MKLIKAGQTITVEGRRTKTGSVKHDETNEERNFKGKQEITNKGLQNDNKDSRDRKIN